MRLSGSRGSNLTRTGAHALVAISFSTTAVQTTLGSHGRIGTGSGVRAGFDPVWSTANRCFDGDARRKSQAIHLVWPLAPPLCKGSRQVFDSGPLPFANALSALRKTWTGTRTMSLCVCPSRSGGRRPTTARTRGISSVCAKAFTVCFQNEFPSHPLS